LGAFINYPFIVRTSRSVRKLVTETGVIGLYTVYVRRTQSDRLSQQQLSFLFSFWWLQQKYGALNAMYRLLLHPSHFTWLDPGVMNLISIILPGKIDKYSVDFKTYVVVW